MHALPGLAILLLATIGAARVVKVSLVGARRAWRALGAAIKRALVRKPRPMHVDAQALVEALLARLVEYRGGSAPVQASAPVQPAARVVAPDAGDTVIDMPRQRRAA